MAVTIVYKHSSPAPAPAAALAPVEIKAVEKTEPKMNATAATLGDVQSIIRAKMTPANKLKLGHMISAINKVAKELFLSPYDVSASPAQLKGRLAEISPAMARLTAGSWSATRSRVLAGLKLADVDVMPGRRTEPLAPPWQTLKELLPKRDGTRPALSRFMGYCTDFEYEPEQISDQHFDRFLSILKAESLRGEPRLIHRNAVRTWNWAAGTVSGWPKKIMTMPPVKSDGYVLPLSTFTELFQRSLADHLEYLRDPPKDDNDAPIYGLKETTLKARQFSLLQIASVRVLGGVPVETLNSICDLPSRAHMELICLFYGPNNNRQKPVQVLTLLDVLRGLPHHQKKDDELAKIITKRVKKLQGKAGRRHGMTKKNKDRLCPFQSPTMVRNFVLLPLALSARAIKKTPDKLKAAHLMRNAIALEIELMCPIRSANLASLSAEQNLIPYKRGKQTQYRLYIPAEEVKNGQEISMDLPEQACALIQLYIKDFRHLLIDPAYLAKSPTYLFPTREGTPMTGKVLAWSICKILKTELGLDFNIHLFRHVACFLYLKQNPAGYETMRRVLGHRQLSTTINYYAELEQLDAFKNFDETILLLRGGAPKKSSHENKELKKPVWIFPTVPEVKFNLNFEVASDVM